MAKRIVDTSQVLKRIRDTSKTEPPVDPKMIAAALGAEPVSALREKAGSPLALLAMRLELARRLQSSGGRPALIDTDRRAKIPLSDQEWQQLESLAATVADKGCAPSAGQVASVLLNLALKSVATEIAAEKTLPISKTQISDQQASDAVPQ